MQNEIDDIKSFLKDNKFISEDNTLSDEEVLQVAKTLMKDYHDILKNCGILINHALMVFESMASRGEYPPELIKTSEFFQGREGFKDYKVVSKQVWPILAVEIEKSKVEKDGK